MTCDVIVVGGGGSGLCAAISAAEAGADVMLLEKTSQLGGTTAMSVGSFSAAGTFDQLRSHVHDSADSFQADMRLANGELNGLEESDLSRLLAENAGPTLNWLRSIGVRFLGPTPEPPFSQPRMHNVIPSSRAYIIALHAEARRRGVMIIRGRRATDLVVDEAGNVVGVQAGREYRAAAVVLATGDYSASPELKRRFGTKTASLVPPVNPNSTGDGFVMGMSVGADVRNMSRLGEQLRLYPAGRRSLVKGLPASPLYARAMCMAARVIPVIPRMIARRALTSWVSPVGRLYDVGAVLVNATGERFANEQNLVETARALAGTAQNLSFVVFDNRIAAQFTAWPNFLSTFPGVAYAYLDDYRRFRSDAFFEAPTVRSLATALGLPSDALDATVERWNASVRDGVDREFGRQNLGAGLERPPYYAIGPLGAVIPITDGGLRIDSQCRALRGDGSPVPGLWAAGATGQGGLLLMNHGLHIAWAMTSGRIAGRAAAKAARKSEREGVDE